MVSGGRSRPGRVKRSPVPCRPARGQLAVPERPKSLPGTQEVRREPGRTPSDPLPHRRLQEAAESGGASLAPAGGGQRARGAAGTRRWPMRLTG